MPKKLGYETTLTIVERAVKRSGAGYSPAPDMRIRDLLAVRIGDIFAETFQRELLRKLIREEVRSAGFGIKQSSIPIDPNITIEHITTTVSSLAGDPGTDDD